MKKICKHLKEIKGNARMIGHYEKKNERNETNMNKWMKLEECIEFSANLAARVGETRDWDNFWELWGFVEGDQKLKLRNEIIEAAWEMKRKSILLQSPGNMNMQQGTTGDGDEIRHDGNETKGPKKKRGRNKKTKKTTGARQMC